MPTVGQLSSPELTREGVRILVEELGVSRAMRFLGDWSQRNRAADQARSEYAGERVKQFDSMTVDEICDQIQAWRARRGDTP